MALNATSNTTNCNNLSVILNKWIRKYIYILISYVVSYGHRIKKNTKNVTLLYYCDPKVKIQNSNGMAIYIMSDSVRGTEGVLNPLEPKVATLVFIQSLVTVWNTVIKDVVHVHDIKSNKNKTKTHHRNVLNKNKPTFLRLVPFLSS